jgi:hypothetical protein
MTTRHRLFVLGFCVLVPAQRASAAVALLDDVTVRVYDSAGVPPAVKQTALAVAAYTLAAASFGVEWVPCDDATRRMSCAVPPAADQFIVRLVRSIGTAPHAPRGQLPLGDAFIDRESRSGVLATIYVDRVILLARLAGIDAATLLGRAIAHEMGHLLLATNAHGTHGLMRPTWSHDELRRQRASDWIFTKEEIAVIRARFQSTTNLQLPTPKKLVLNRAW